MKTWIIIAVAILVIAALVWLILGNDQNHKMELAKLQDKITAIEEEKDPEASASPSVEPAAEPSITPSSEPELTVEDAVQWAEKGWEKDETDELASWQICDGDVEVDITKEQADKLGNDDEAKDVDVGEKFFTFYDEGGEGQCTLVVNISSKPIDVYSAYAAGRINLTEAFNLEEQINYVLLKEWARKEKGKDLFHEIRVVIINDDGIKQYFVKRAEKTIILDNK